MKKIKFFQELVFQKISSSFKLLSVALKILSHKEKIILFFSFIVFIISSGAILWRINNIYSVEIQDIGGELNEGVVGAPRFINPLLAVSDTDRDLIKLIYGGLMDTYGKRNLFPVLASKYEIGENGLAYTFYINQKARWHDGKPVKSDDVIFTIKLAKDPILNSLKRASWEGVEVEKSDDYTVRFWLKAPYAGFLENTTLPILPKHIWEKIMPEEMSLSNFNIQPIGSGPFKVKKIYRDSSGIISSYKLKANKNFILGRPFVRYLNIYFFNSEEKLIDAYRRDKINITGFISPINLRNVLRKESVARNLTLPRIFGAFFNSANNPIFAEKEIREALNSAIDKKFIIDEVLGGYGSTINSPIPPGSIGFSTFEENNLSRDEKTEQAKKMLEKNGWKPGKDGIFEKKVRKETMRLNFTVSTSNVPDMAKTAEILKDAWEKMGAKVELKFFENSDFNQNVIRKRNYEILLFGEMVGREPD